MKKYRDPSGVRPPIAAYSHQVEVRGQQRWLVISGQLGENQDGFVPNDPVDQLKAALENVRRNLAAADMEITDLVKLTVYAVGCLDKKRRRETISAWLNGCRPCVTMLFVAGLAEKRYKIEVEAIASRAE